MKALARTWERFWFTPEPTSTLALVRIAFGLVTFAWTVALLPVSSPLLGARGVVPSQPPGTDPTARGTWGLLDLVHGDGALVALFVVMFVSSACLVLGYRTRLAALLVFVGMISFQRRDPFLFDSGDGLLRITAFYLALAPSGASLSLDRLRRARERFWDFPSRAGWPL